MCSVATIQGSDARSEIDATIYAPTAFRILDGEGKPVQIGGADSSFDARPRPGRAEARPTA